MESQMSHRNRNLIVGNSEWFKSLSRFSDALASGDTSQRSSLEQLERGAANNPEKLHLLSQHLRQHSALDDALRIISKALAADPSNLNAGTIFETFVLTAGSTILIYVQLRHGNLF